MKTMMLVSGVILLFLVKSSLGGLLECEQICKGITKSVPKPGPLDYRIIDKAVETRMLKLTKSLDKKMLEMQRKYEEKLETTLKSMKNEVQRTREALCPVKYNNKCFWIVADEDATYEDAETSCAKVAGGKPANLYDQKHYELVITYMRTQIPQDIFGLYLWIGMTYDPRSKEVKTNDGKTSEFVKWREHYPGLSYDYTGLLIMARQDQNKKHEGVYNQNPIYEKPGVLCEV